ncbi:CBS domain-containing protein [Planctopirus hydrillae]|uniref:CBS domain-containing protein n=1 Tax=Planctopirus hydrillae TaxID=1841610 RepID=A0A1C3ENR3_9PLAN|nr:CBS domain-containing protein [Planctopirus hydrillae]ODA34864.1 hypothetical protein A6X21_04220 [Planctopirus hydrillae]
MRLTVADLMTTAVTISPQATLTAALKLLISSKAQELFVVGPRKKLLGILPDYELLKAQLAETDPDAKVERWMVTSMQTLSPATDLAIATNLFRAGNCSRAAVVEKGQLVGVVSRFEILRLCLILRVDAPHTTPSTMEVETHLEPAQNSKTKARLTTTSRTSTRATPEPATTKCQVPEPKFISTTTGRQKSKSSGRSKAASQEKVTSRAKAKRH